MISDSLSIHGLRPYCCWIGYTVRFGAIVGHLPFPSSRRHYSPAHQSLTHITSHPSHPYGNRAVLTAALTCLPCLPCPARTATATVTVAQTLTSTPHCTPPSSSQPSYQIAYLLDCLGLPEDPHHLRATNSTSALIHLKQSIASSSLLMCSQPNDTLLQEEESALALHTTG